MADVVTIKKGQSTSIDLESRGAIGLSLEYKVDKPSIVVVTRMDNNEAPENIGGSITASFNIVGLQAGNCIVEFFETKTWDKSFTPIVKTKLEITVLG